MLGLWLLLGGAGPAPIVGRATVIDGDTISVANVQVRLWGVDAPEGRQACRDAAGRSYRCGETATARLRALTAAGPVTCIVRDHDAYGRAVSQCRAGSRDLGLEMVRGGMALEYRQFSGGVYAAVESEARHARRGLWAGSFEQPAAWRAGERATAGGVPQPDPAGCVLKGNINAKGLRIVHAPGQRDYGATRIDPARGERWFCSAEEARAAGWIPAAR